MKIIIFFKNLFQGRSLGVNRLGLIEAYDSRWRYGDSNSSPANRSQWPVPRWLHIAWNRYCKWQTTESLGSVWRSGVGMDTPKCREIGSGFSQIQSHRREFVHPIPWPDKKHTLLFEHIQNEDELCFLYSVAASVIKIDLRKMQPHRTHHYREAIKNFNIDGLTFPFAAEPNSQVWKAKWGL